MKPLKLQPLESPRMLNHALNYARRKLKVFPCFEPFEGVCSCGDPECGKNAGKHPRNAHGLSEATSDQNQIRYWWSIWPNANIGLACGDGFFVLDIDPRHGGNDSLEKLESKYGKLPVTLRALTGGGGQHIFLMSGNPVKCRIGMLPGIDIKGTGGYVVAAPSLHISGRRYLWNA